MPDDIGTEGSRDRGLTITLSTPFVESLTPTQLSHYVSTVAELGSIAHEHGEDELASTLRATLAQEDIALPEQSYLSTVRQLASAHPGQLAIVTDRDTVLFGDPRGDSQSRDPGVDGAADPEHPDRPAYS